VTAAVERIPTGGAGVRAVPRGGAARKRRRLFIALGSALAAVAVAGGVLVPRLLDHSSSKGAERRAVHAYVAAIRPVAKRGGQVVVENVRPRLTDLELGQVSAEQFRSEAPGWKQDMEKARRAFAAAPVPAPLRRAAALYDQAFRGYERAFDAFVVASYEPRGEQLNAAIADAAKGATNADHLYDRAGALVKAEQRRVGDRGPGAP